MRRDLDATAQMGGESFADAQEAEAWKGEKRDISNLTHPFSGSERNRLFLNRGGKEFLDISGLSGIDSPADGRVAVWFDYDRDGRQDVAVINSSRPLLQIYHNRIADDQSDSPQGVIAIRFVGGNSSAETSKVFSNRDGFGVKVQVQFAAGPSLFREHLPSQGLAGKNSDTMLVGLGTRRIADRVEITWPSGRTQSIVDVPSGTLLTAYENPADPPANAPSETPDGFVIDRWQRDGLGPIASTDRPDQRAELFLDRTALLQAAESDRSDPKLLVVTTMASWCTSCARHQPTVNELRQSFPPDELEVIGFAADPDDPAAAVREFLERNRSEYPAIEEPTDELRTAIDRVSSEMHGSDALPTSIVIRADGHVLHVDGGIPSVSDVRRYLQSL